MTVLAVAVVILWALFWGVLVADGHDDSALGAAVLASVAAIVLAAWVLVSA